MMPILATLAQALFLVTCGWLTISLLLRSLFSLLRSRSISHTTAGIPISPVMYDTVLHADRDWFSYPDLLHRYSLALLGYTLVLMTHPVNFTIYTYHTLRVNNGRTWITALMPVLPAVYVVWSGIRHVTLGPDSASIYCSMSGEWAGEEGIDADSARFFAKSEHCDGLKGFLWDVFQDLSFHVGNFLQVDTCLDGIKTGVEDFLTTRPFWQGLLREHGADTPRVLGTWKGNTLEYEEDITEFSIVAKIANSCMGIGDSFWDKGKDFETVADLEALLRARYTDCSQEVQLLKLLRPDPGLGVHSLDVVTVRKPCGKVDVVSCLVWTECSTSSSHSSTACYTIDLDTERTFSSASWYSPAFKPKKTSGLGVLYPGVRDAAEIAVKAHQHVEMKWITGVGWDAMVLEDGTITFFEGNVTTGRMPRRMFLAFSCFMEYLVNYRFMAD